MLKETKQKEKESVKKSRKKGARERGITLVALVITVIIIIILATVTINMAFGDNGLITQAQRAKDMMANSTVAEQEGINGVMSEYLNVMGEDSEIPLPDESWHYDEDGNVTDGTVTLEIGDYVNYDCTTSNASYTSLSATNGYEDQIFTASSYQYGWRVLGVDEETGKLLIISEELIGPTTGGSSSSTYNRTYYYLRGQAGYANGVNELNAISAIYGNGEGATGARSITVDDINKITGYNPETANYGEGEINEYGNKVTYYWDGTNYPYYTTTNGLTENLTRSHNNSSYGNSFYWYDSELGWQSSPYSSTATTTNRQEITTLESNYYYYYPNTLTTSSSGDTVGIDTTSTAYKMLFTNSSTGAYTSGSGSTSGFYYWLGSPYVNTDPDYVTFGVRRVDGGYVRGYNLCGSYGLTNRRDYGVRPVVSLESNVSLTDSGTIKDGCTLWNIG